MKIPSKLVVTQEGANFTFKPLMLDDWGLLVRARETGDPSTQFDLVIDKLLGVEGLTFDDGTPITLEDIKGKQVVPARFYRTLLDMWSGAVAARAQQEAEAGNESTPASSDSSVPA
jgi:hypothetical protein